jgi:cell division protein FtsQ
MRRLALPAIFTARKTGFSIKAGLVSFTLILTAICGVAGYFKAYLLRDEFHRIAIAQGFTPRIIEITGRNHTDKQDIAAIANQMKGKSILAIDLMAMREDILQLGWVEDVVIIRTLPDKLEIRLSERQPVALLQSAKGHQLIDASGAVIHGANPANFNHLIVASGKGAAERAGMIIDILRTEPEIFSDVWAVQYISQRRWDIHMRSGLAIRLPERDPVLAWSRLAKLEQETAITARDLAAIDLRVPGQLIVEPNIPIRGKGRKT